MLRLWFVIVMICSSAANALTIEHRVLGQNPLSAPVLELELSGGIEKGDAARLAALLHSYAGQSFREISVTLNSPGGSLIEGLGIAGLLMGRDEIVTAQVGTFAQPAASCASACVLIYLGADLRYLGKGGRIGVHQFFDPTGQISGDQALDLAQRLSSEIVSVMREQRVDLAFFDRMTQTAHGIDWVPRDRLEQWRVVTGSVFDEWMEYKNIDGKVGLHMFHESLYGTNQMTLYCDRGLIGYAVLQEPRLAVVGSLMLVVSGQSYRIEDFEILNRNNGRTRAFFRIPQALLPALRTAQPWAPVSPCPVPTCSGGLSKASRTTGCGKWWTAARHSRSSNPVRHQ